MENTGHNPNNQKETNAQPVLPRLGHGVSRLSGAEVRRQKRLGMARLLVLAIIVGVGGGYAAIGFYEAINALTILFYASDEKSLATGVRALDWWHVLLAPVIAGLVVGQMLRFFKDHRAQGVPHVMEAAILKGGQMPLRQGLWSAFITVISIGGGASTGREGPVVHLGATVASFCSRRFNLSREAAKTLLGCGAAAAIAASFNAPIAGVFFALEVILGHYSLSAFAPIVLSAVTATIVARFHIGDLPTFQVSGQEIISFAEFPAFFLLGVCAALLSALFMQSMAIGERYRDRVLPMPYWLQPAIGGLIVGTIALWHPEILGVGYEATTQAINGAYGLELLIPLLIAKFIAIVVSLTFRFGGGVFSPSLVLGALLGGSFGLIASSFSPEPTSSEGLYAIVGMGAVASAVLGAPISTVLIVFELTGDYSVAIAVMVACASASLLVTYIKDGSMFHQQLRARNIHLIGGAGTHLLEGETLDRYSTPIDLTLPITASLADAYNLLPRVHDMLFIVTDEKGSYCGVLPHDALPPLTRENEAEPIVELVNTSLEPLSPTTPVGKALRQMEKLSLDTLPVASTDKDTSCHVVRYKMILKAHNRALLFAQGHEEEESQGELQK